MKKRGLTALLLVASIIGITACDRMSETERDGLGPGGYIKWNDPNYEIITAGSYNYTDYDIYGVYLLPPDKSDLDFASSADGARATRRDEEHWQGGLGGRASLAWDFRWTTPKKFKVWWFRVVDKALLESSNNKFDPYTSPGKEPGSAWCEGEITITKPPIKDKAGGLLLHFFPDGRVEGDMDFSKEVPPPKVELAKRDEQPKLEGRPCLKEIANPFYGKKKPVQQN